MSILLDPFLQLVSSILGLYTWCLVVSAILTWLVHFNIVNSYNPTVRKIGLFLYQVTEPLLRPIRRILPFSTSIDFSPVVLILVIGFIQNIIARLLFKIALPV